MILSSVIAKGENLPKFSTNIPTSEYISPLMLHLRNKLLNGIRID